MKIAKSIYKSVIEILDNKSPFYNILKNLNIGEVKQIKNKSCEKIQTIKEVVESK